MRVRVPGGSLQTPCPFLLLLPALCALQIPEPQHCHAQCLQSGWEPGAAHSVGVLEMGQKALYSLKCQKSFCR